MLEEDQFACRIENPGNALHGFQHAWNRAHRKGAHHRVDARVRQRNALSGQIKKLNRQAGSALLFFSFSQHPGIRFERIDFIDSGGIIMYEVHAGPYTDFEHRSLSQRDNAAADCLDGFRIPKYGHQMWVDSVSIEGHSIKI